MDEDDVKSEESLEFSQKNKSNTSSSQLPSALLSVLEKK